MPQKIYRRHEMVIATPHIPLVDAHAHVFRRDLPFIPNAVHRFDRDYTIEDYISVLDRSGVHYGVIAAASFLGTYHDYTLEALANHKRLRATVVVDPDVEASRLRDLDQAGVVGIRFAVANMSNPPDLRSPAYRRLFEMLGDLGWHVHVFARPEQLPSLVDAIDESGVNLVVDHFGVRGNEGGPGSESFQVLINAMNKGRTWVKLSAPYWSDSLNHKELVSTFIKEAGSNRLLWASDWPFVKLDGALPYSQAVAWLSDWVEDRSVLQQIDKNAAELYGFPNPSA
jgi:predicted TIM-barrel fold metal-dependent hydrolase